MLGDKLGHFEHVDLVLAAEDLAQFFVSFNIALVLRILEIMLLYLCPKAFHDHGARHGAFPDDSFELFGELHRFHERGIFFCHICK